jgi:hypothetical protein
MVVNNNQVKVITDWGWMYGTGPHLDILIDPKKVTSKKIEHSQSQTKVNTSISNIPNTIPNKNTNKFVTINSNKEPKNVSIQGKDTVKYQTGLLGKLSPTQIYKKSTKKNI